MCELYHIFFDLPCPSDEKSLYFKNNSVQGTGTGKFEYHYGQNGLGKARGHDDI